MTDTTMFKLIREDFQGVKDSVNTLSGKISGMESTVNGVKETLDRHETAIKETREAQLSCKAAGGWDVLNREIKIAREKQNGYRGRIRDELKDLREDQTGQQDVPVVEAKQTNGSMVWGFFKTFGPWIVAGLVILGIWLGSGGDAAKTQQIIRSLQTIGARVEKIEKSKTEPVRVPVPVSSERFSEEVVFRDPP